MLPNVLEFGDSRVNFETRFGAYFQYLLSQAGSKSRAQEVESLSSGLIAPEPTATLEQANYLTSSPPPRGILLKTITWSDSCADGE